jgi:hypothetical protein
MEFGSAFAGHRRGRLLLVAALVTLGVFVPGSQALGSFGAATNVAVGENPSSVAIGDLNGDNNPDLAVANAGSDNVSVLLGAGTGSFGAATNFDTGNYPSSVAIGHLNGDSSADLAVANAASNNVSVLFGTGNGTFGVATNFNVGIQPTSVAIGHLNGDSSADLAVANAASSNDVSVLLGIGNGSFVGGSFISYIGLGASSVAIGKLNGDNNPDLAVANSFSSDVSVLLGTGAAQIPPGGPGGINEFGAASNFPVGSRPASIVIGDLNGDTNSDLAVANEGSDNVSVLVGTGTGSFGAATNFAAGQNPQSLAIGKLNDDNKPDLAVANFRSNSVSLLPGTGTGSFGAATDFAAGQSPTSLAIGKLNDDNKPDLAVANFNSDNVSILLNGVPKGSTGGPRIKRISVRGPAKTKWGRKALYTVKIRNTGDAQAKRVRLKVRGKGIRYSKSVGRIQGGKTRKVKIKLKPKKPGKVKLTFKVTSKNAGGKTVKKKIKVKK